MTDPAIIEAAARALVQRLEAAANILKKHPCEVYGLEADCREAAAIIPRIEADALEEAAKVAENIARHNDGNDDWAGGARMGALVIACEIRALIKPAESSAA